MESRPVFKELAGFTDKDVMGLRAVFTQNRTRRSGSDAGFTLIEMVVALGIVTVLFTALAYAMMGGVEATRAGRQNQQAIDLANGTLEQVRNLDWSMVAHDPASVTVSQHNGEDLVTSNGALTSNVANENVNGTDYTVTTWITSPTDTTGDYRRISVSVDWADGESALSRTASTVVTYSTRGLPLPDFTLTQVGDASQTVNPSATAAWGFTLTNQGAPDQWNIASSGDFAVTFYQDDGDSVYSAADDTVPLTDHNGDGTVDTGRLDPNESIVFWAVYSAPATTPSPDPDSDNFTDISATSSGQPDAASASQSIEVQLTVQTGVITPSPTGTSTATPTPTATTAVCADSNPAPTPAGATGYSVIEYVPHNSGNTAWPSYPLSEPITGSSALQPMVMNQTAVSIPESYSLPELSTDLSPSGTAGRILYTGGSFSGDASRVADWQANTATKDYTNSIAVRLYVNQISGNTADISLDAQLYAYRSQGNKTSTLSEVSVQNVTLSPYSCSGFQEISFDFPITGVIDMPNNYVLGLRVWNTGSESVRLAYDHETYPASVTVVEK